ncbi:hypothetical protein HUO09_17105 [Vibrio sp. Y2-5]|uniref:hypothetical protein n=1 Tax=Vibrio sp. Y2-5 TaxID=2743977 RepID=UPI00166043DC|nr:hypothetical protein [Vibrio sp. Y2-5]MBD0788075.1 hypothetical protein [Vibrio sp. Y2-5]
MADYDYKITAKMKIDAFGMKRLPVSFRRWWALSGNWFWMPCPICKIDFGGHENSHVTIPQVPVEDLPNKKQLAERHNKHEMVCYVRKSICPCCAIELITNEDTRLNKPSD